MNCDQIRTYLPDFVAGTLPRPKAAWVVQHVAGCSPCAQALADQRAAAARPAAAGSGAAESQTAATAEAAWTDLRRPVPRWVRPVALVAAVLLVAGAAWVVLRPAGWAGQSAAARRPQVRPVAYASQPERLGGVTLGVTEVSQEGEDLHVRLSLSGDDLRLPETQIPYVYLQPANGSLVNVHDQVVRADDTSIQLDVSFARALLNGADQFSLRVVGVHQEHTVTGTLPLPDHPAPATPARGTLPGARGGLRLLSFGYAGDMLEVQVGLEGAAGLIRQTPTLYLRDANNVSYAPTFIRLIPGSAGQNLALEFPRPAADQASLALVGEWTEDRYLGPWVVGVTLRP